MTFDVIIIGTGIAGIVLAERSARKNNVNVLLIEQRNHIGGNCYDCYDDKGILIQPYGPHIFHTDNQKVWRYLSKFTDWHYYQHKVVGLIDGQIVPIPFNLNTLYKLIPNSLATKLEDKLISQFGLDKKLPLKKLMQIEDGTLQFLADFIRKKIFLNYTVKQWGGEPEDISAEILNRVPVSISKDDRYFVDIYQGLPKYGYTKMFEKMLKHPKIKVLLNTNMNEVIDLNLKTGKIKFMNTLFTGQMIYTGMIDELFDYKFGELPYRALDFDHETLAKEDCQSTAVINYPNNYSFTRITEFKHLTGQTHHFTSILREYPCQYSRVEEKIPCYPILSLKNQRIYQKYMKLIKEYDNILPIGRLAEYRYYDMDDMVDRALSIFENKLSRRLVE